MSAIAQSRADAVLAAIPATGPVSLMDIDVRLADCLHQVDRLMRDLTEVQGMILLTNPDARRVRGAVDEIASAVRLTNCQLGSIERARGAMPIVQSTN